MLSAFGAGACTPHCGVRHVVGWVGNKDGCYALAVGGNSAHIWVPRSLDAAN